MADNRKYYYLKLKEDFFDTDEMKILESMKDGYLYSNILLKLYLKSLSNSGRLMYRNVIPYTPEILATLTGHQVGTVEKALDVFKNWYFTGEQRTGCCVCGFGCHLEPVPNRLQRLRTSDNDKHRRMCEGCLQIKNHGMTYEQALNYAGIPTEEVQEDE